MGSKLVKLIHLCVEKNIPFVSYQLPRSGRITTWIQRSGKMQFVEDIADVEDNSGFIYAPFHRYTDFPVVFFEPEYIFEEEDINDQFINELEIMNPLYPGYKEEVPFQVNRDEYIHQAENMIRHFDHNLSKAVLSRVKLIEKPNNFHPGDYFIKLLKLYPDAFCHMIHIPGAGCWTGASPEMLLRNDRELFRTIALAGTQKFHGKIDVPWGKKETEEQEIVTRHIVSVLDRCGIRDFTIDPPVTVIAGQVLHRSTEIRFQITPNRIKIAEFLGLLHPSPAVSGFPKDSALALIRQTEKHNREYYAGYCGPLNFLGNTDLFVNLRCMKILPKYLALFIGGGITSESIPQNEWEETELKAITLLSVI